uniref:Uncharacterized protein n=1 Tax=Arundo donax TaxID=35708 RepID=A0A0A9CIA7_ARUDO
MNRSRLMPAKFDKFIILRLQVLTSCRADALYYFVLCWKY